MKKAIVSVALWAAAVASFGQGKMPFLTSKTVVLFQGDSITDGGRWRTGNDYNHIMGQSYAYLLAAELGAEFANAM